MIWGLITGIFESVSDVKVYSDLSVDYGYGLSINIKDLEIAFWRLSVQRDKRN